MKKPEIKNKNKNKEKHNSNNNNNDNYNNRRRREETPFGDRRRRPWRWRRRLISPAAAASRRLPKKKRIQKKYISKRSKDEKEIKTQEIKSRIQLICWKWIGGGESESFDFYQPARERTWAMGRGGGGRGGREGFLRKFRESCREEGAAILGRRPKRVFQEMEPGTGKYMVNRWRWIKPAQAYQMRLHRTG